MIFSYWLLVTMLTMLIMQQCCTEGQLAMVLTGDILSLLSVRSSPSHVVVSPDWWGRWQTLPVLGYRQAFITSNRNTGTAVTRDRDQGEQSTGHCHDQIRHWRVGQCALGWTLGWTLKLQIKFIIISREKPRHLWTSLQPSIGL